MTYKYEDEYKVDPWCMPDHIKEEFNKPVTGINEAAPQGVCTDHFPGKKINVPENPSPNPTKEEWNPGGYSTKGGFSRLAQVGGDHYKKYEVQPWDIIEMYDLDFFEGNALKYLLRNKSDRLEDLKKCRHYLDKAIERKENDAND